MVKITHATRKPLRVTRFANKRLDPVGIELLTVAELRNRVPARQFLEAERVEFFMVLVTTKGRGGHLVDFERFDLRAGHVIFVRPGQVQQWQPATGLEADVLLINPAMLQTRQQGPMSLLQQEDWPIHFTLDSYGLSVWQSLSAILRKELVEPGLDALSAAIARELLLCLMLSISRSATEHQRAPTEQSMLIRRFRRELEGLVHVRPSVALLARNLGVSTSTLVRASNEVLGHSAKVEVDRRVALEAQRLLVHSASTSVDIGERLGFSEPTNFVKFFRRIVGVTPEAFRQAHRLQAPQ